MSADAEQKALTQALTVIDNYQGHAESYERAAVQAEASAKAAEETRGTRGASDAQMWRSQAAGYRAEIPKFEKQVADAQAVVSRLSGKVAFSQGATAVLPGDEAQRGQVLLRTGRDQVSAPTVAIAYDSLASFLEAAGKTPVMRDNVTHWTKTKQRSPISPQWEGMTRQMTFDQVAEFLRLGWPEGAQKIAADLAWVEAPLGHDIRRRGAWADSGMELNLDRLHAGNYDTPWRTATKQASYGPTHIRIVVDIGSECSACGNVCHDAAFIDAQGLFWRGAAAAKLSECLEAAGYTTDILAAWGIIDTRSAFQCRSIMVKETDTATDLGRIASACAATATFRRVALLEHLATATYEVAERHGPLITVDRSPRLQQALGLIGDDIATVYVSDWVLTRELANAWVKGVMYGIESPKTGMTADDLEAEAVA